jgi:hypothetical protein
VAEKVEANIQSVACDGQVQKLGQRDGYIDSLLACVPKIKLKALQNKALPEYHKGFGA